MLSDFHCRSKTPTLSPNISLPQLWVLLEGRLLFRVPGPSDSDYEYDDQTHLAYMTALLDPPSQELLVAGRSTSLFYTPDGEFIAPTNLLLPLTHGMGRPPQRRDVNSHALTFESALTNIHGDEKRRLIRFIRRMVARRPEDRSTAKELAEDSWLCEVE